MKKVLIASLLVALSGSVFAASSGKALVAGANTVTSGAGSNCELLSADVTVTLSTGNIGQVSCDDTTANIGVAVGNTSGKGKIFSIGSSGGAVTTTNTAGGVAPTTTDMSSQATARAASS